MAQQDDVLFSCPECGTEVVEGAQGCGRCGTKLEWDETDTKLISASDKDGTLYLSNERRAQSAKRALTICAFLASIEIVLIISTVSGAINTHALYVKSPDAVIYQAPGFLDIVLLYLIAGLVTAFFFLKWLYRAFLNLDALSASPGDYTPQSAVWKFLIPIVNIHQSLKIVSELWRRSNPPTGIMASAKQRKYVKEVQSWWTAYIVSILLPEMTFKGLLPNNWYHNLVAVGGVYCVTHGLTIVAAVLLIRIINEIDGRQEASSKQLLLQGKLKMATE